MGNFPTFTDLIPTLTYRPPKERAPVYAVALLALTALHDFARKINPDHPNFAGLAEAVEGYAKAIGALLPVAHPDATAAFRVLAEARMYMTRAMGGNALFSPDEYDAEIRSVLMRLEIAVATAITSQPAGVYITEPATP